MTRGLLSLTTGVLIVASSAAAQTQMPDPKQIAGVPLPATDLPAGTMSVRVIRGSFANNIADLPVEFSIDGKVRRATTDGSGRAQVAGLSRGARVRAVAVVAGARLESQEIVVGETGVRVVLVAVDPEAEKRAAEDRRLAEAPAVSGLVVLGPESRVVVEMSNDKLNVFYLLQILNTARTPVDTGGPLVFQLPRDARGAAVLQGSSTQAKANGPRVTVTGPFAPGPTVVHVGYEQPYRGGTARIEQKWPAALQQLAVLVPQIGGLDLRSPQITSMRQVTDQGQTLIVASGPAIAAGQSLVLEITGLPHHPVWPQYVALTLAAGIMSAGIWAAVFSKPRRRAA